MLMIGPVAGGETGAVARPEAGVIFSEREETEGAVKMRECQYP